MHRGGAPKNWQYMYEKIKTMRARQVAPVDTMGCHKLTSPGATPQQARFQVLIGLMLSSQTRDEVTAAAMRRLHASLDPLTIETVLGREEDELAKIIYPVGFYRRKAKTLRQVAAILRDQYDSDVPRTLEELQKLPGIGPKMALLTLQTAWSLNMGIGVDVHVHRISNRLGWVRTQQPEKTRQALEEWLPSQLWPEINPLFVGFGQTVCLPVKPKCEGCLLKDVCPASTAKPIRKRSKVEDDDGDV